MESAPRRACAAIALVLAPCLPALLAGCGGEGGREPGSPPVAAFPQPEHDFGEVLEGERVEHAFAVENRGGSELVLEAVEVPPELTLEGFDSPIPHRGEGQVRVAFDTAGKKGSGSLQIQVRSNDPEAPEQTLTLSGRVVEPVEVRPQNRIYFFDRLQGEPAVEEVTLLNHQDRPLEILEVRPGENGLFQLELETLEEGQVYRLRVRLAPEAPVGKHQETLVLTTDSPEVPTLEIHAFASIHEVVWTEPGEVSFGRIRFDDLEREEVAVRTVRVRSEAGGGFQVRDASLDVPFVELSIEEVKPGETYLVRLAIDPQRARRGEVEGTLVVRTSDPRFPELRLPVSGTIL